MKYKKLIAIVPITASLAGSALADGIGMMGYGMMGNGSYGFMGGWMLFWWLLGVGLVSFVFSMVFWQCYKWLVEEKKSGRRK